jgi:hypothetical protein
LTHKSFQKGTGAVYIYGWKQVCNEVVSFCSVFFRPIGYIPPIINVPDAYRTRSHLGVDLAHHCEEEQDAVPSVPAWQKAAYGSKKSLSGVAAMSDSANML